jgi:hypothetical protein
MLVYQRVSIMEVSINGGTPIAGWLISWKIPSKNWMI